MLSLGGFLLPFIIMSMSSYKLPHYIYVLFPLSSLLLADWWEQNLWTQRKKYALNLAVAFQWLVLLISAAVIGLIYFWFFQGAPFFSLFITFALLAVAMIYMIKPKANSTNLIMASALASVALNFSINSWFYPRVLDYQAGSQMAYAIDELDIPVQDVYGYNYYNFSFIYYFGNQNFKRLNGPQVHEKVVSGEQLYLVALEEEYRQLQEDFELRVVEKLQTHSATRLNLKFLNPQTREEKLKPVYLLKIESVL
jgi:4-amino-4-deoxy-L-arabinose transferase-like glycosyltransferase